MSVRARFAPSPTGPVHIGNIRVAIFNWLYARHEGGRFLLRVEDTDRERSTPEALRVLLDALEWLGLDYDEPPLYQSTRIAAYQAAAKHLIRGGHAYRENKDGKGECVMFRMPGADIFYKDEIKGELHKRAEDLKDFLIVRSDGHAVFHLANVVDDIEMRVTLIMRGDDHVENTYRHVAMFRALGAEPPKYAHLPMIVNAQGKPYSKRDGDAFVGDFRDKGFLPQALFNYLTLLGWSPGDDREKLSREELINLFTLDRVKSGPAQVDLKKLLHLNGRYMAELPAETFVAGARRQLCACDWWRDVDDAYLRQVCALMQSRARIYPQVEEWKHFFFDAPDYEEKAVKKILGKGNDRALFGALKTRLESAAFTVEAVERALRAVETDLGLGHGHANQPVRVAVTGRSTGAGIAETLALLGKSRVLVRLDHALARLSG
ncbi:MAG: glutamate--tRNA ligase family protein [Verrucomicrobiota bacterium]|nr:glutamate--tRNA ligase family protein [Verrucomicrobiota bacterium]